MRICPNPIFMLPMLHAVINLSLRGVIMSQASGKGGQNCTYKAYQAPSPPPSLTVGKSSDLRRQCTVSHRAPMMNRLSACFTWFGWGGVLNRNSSSSLISESAPPPKLNGSCSVNQNQTPYPQAPYLRRAPISVKCYFHVRGCFIFGISRFHDFHYC